MPFTIQQKNLFDIVQKAIQFVPSKTSLQILVNFKLIFTPDRLEILATDLDHSIKLDTDIKGDKEHEIVINARKFFEIIKELHDDELTIDFDNNVLIIESGGSFSCKVACTDARDFPDFPEIEDYTKIVLSKKDLQNMIFKSSFAVSKDDARECLRGVLWEVERNKTGMVSTDGHRLGSSFYKKEFDLDVEIASILSQKTLLHIAGMFISEDLDTDIEVQFGEKYVVFKDESFTICSKLINGPYPDYEKVIPSNNTKKATINRYILIEAVRRVSVLSSQKTHLIKLIFKSNELEIAVLNRDIGGEAHQVIPVDYEGEEHIIGLNSIFFTEIINIIKTDSIRLEMNTTISPCLIFSVYKNEDEKESDDTFLIMPLKILEEIEE